MLRRGFFYFRARREEIADLARNRDSWQDLRFLRDAREI